MTTKKEHMPEEYRLKELLLGKTIVSAQIKNENPAPYESGPTGYITLSDGKVLKVWGNDGGCACDSGCYPLTHLVKTEGMITGIDVEENPNWDDKPCEVCDKSYCYEHQGYYRVFVLTEAQGRSLLASFEGSDGNGYYGTGWWLSVQETEEIEA